MTRPMQALEDDLRRTLLLFPDKADLMWSRTVDWQRIRPPSTEERGGGSGGAASDQAVEDRLGDAAAARYHDELKALVRRLTTDLRRLQRIAGIVLPAQPRKIQGRDMLAAQVAAEGWCVSCWRDDQYLHPIEKDPKGHKRHRDLCRFCGGWKAEHGDLPPMDVLRRLHEGRRIRVKA